MTENPDKEITKEDTEDVVNQTDVVLSTSSKFIREFGTLKRKTTSIALGFGLAGIASVLLISSNSPFKIDFQYKSFFVGCALICGSGVGALIRKETEEDRIDGKIKTIEDTQDLDVKKALMSELKLTVMNNALKSVNLPPQKKAEILMSSLLENNELPVLPSNPLPLEKGD